jgi:hypothetical protein
MNIKLSSTGLAHYVLPVAVVSLVAIGGVAALVATNANSVKPAKITKLKILAPKTVKGIRDEGLNGQICAKINMGYYVTTKGAVDKVEVLTPGSYHSNINIDKKLETNMDGGTPKELTLVSTKGKWGDRDGKYSPDGGPKENYHTVQICSSQQGKKVKLDLAADVYATAYSADGAGGYKSSSLNAKRQLITIKE